MFTLLSLLSLLASGAPAAATPSPVCPAAQVATDKPGQSPYVGGTDGYFFRLLSDLRPPIEPKPPNLELLSLFTAALAERGTRLVLAPMPPRGLVHADKVDRADPLGATVDIPQLQAGWSHYLQTLRNTGARVADSAAVPTDGTFYFPADSHWAPAGAKAAGRAIAQELADLPAPRRTLRSVEDGSFPVPVQLGEKVAGLCDFTLAPPGRAPRFRPEAQPGSLTEEARPEIVLAGTSNSNFGHQDQVNFAGWIEAASGLGVLNYGVVAGGAETAMLSVLRDAELWARPPLALVWELPTTASFTDAADLREFIALLEPPCTAANAIAEGTGKADGSPILTLPPEQKIAGTGWFVQVETDPTLLKFMVDFNHGIKAPDRISISRINFIQQTGEARLLLNPVRRTPLLTLSVTSREEGKTPPVTVRICPTTSAALRPPPIAGAPPASPRSP